MFQRGRVGLNRLLANKKFCVTLT